MPRQKSHDIDRLFVAGSEQHKYAYNPDAWAQLDQRLDQRADQRRKRRYLWLLLLVGIGGLAILSTQLRTTLEPSISDEQLGRTTPSNTSMSTSPVQPPPIWASSIDDDLTSPELDGLNENDDKLTLVGSTTSSTAADTPTAAPSTGRDTGYPIPPPAETQSASSTGTVQALLPPVSGSEGEHDTDAVASAASISAATDNIPAMDQQDVIQEEDLAPSVKITPRLPDLQSLVVTDSQTIYTDTREIITLPQPARPLPWTIEVFAGPEWSVLSGDSDLARGARAGVKLGYRLSPSWSIHAGVAYSQKLFNGSGEDFDNDALFTDAIPSRMEGKSAFIEIPVSIRYTGKRRAGRQWYIEAGLTNFNHRSEWYGFEYDPADQQPGLMVEIPSQQVNKMALGASRLAIGYDISLTDKTTIGIAPYIQVPLRGIGAGNVNIYSTGIEVIYRLR